MAAAIDHYRLYWYCPPDDVLADTAEYLSDISHQVADADHQRLIDRLRHADHTAPAPLRSLPDRLVAHQLIVEQLASIANSPRPSSSGEGATVPGADARRCPDAATAPCRRPPVADRVPIQRRRR